MSRFRRDLNPIRDGKHCWLSKCVCLSCLRRRRSKPSVRGPAATQAIACLACRKQDAQNSSHVSNVVMLTINSRSPWEMISGFNLTAIRAIKSTALFSLRQLVTVH